MISPRGVVERKTWPRPGPCSGDLRISSMPATAARQPLPSPAVARRSIREASRRAPRASRRPVAQQPELGSDRLKRPQGLHLRPQAEIISWPACRSAATVGPSTVMICRRRDHVERAGRGSRLAIILEQAGLVVQLEAAAGQAQVEAGGSSYAGHRLRRTASTASTKPWGVRRRTSTNPSNDEADLPGHLPAFGHPGHSE